MKYAQQEIVLSQEQRRNLNDKVIYLIDSDSADASGITKEDIYNAYTGDGGLHGLNRGEYENYHIIYVKDGQSYFTFRSDCASATDNRIVDPIVMIYTSNIHCNYAHSIVSQWLYFYSDEENPEDVYQSIKPYVLQCGAEESVQQVSPAE